MIAQICKKRTQPIYKKVAKVEDIKVNEIEASLKAEIFDLPVEEDNVFEEVKPIRKNKRIKEEEND